MSYAETLSAKPITVGEAFSDARRYRVPLFQRDYAWEEDQWEELWADIMALDASPEGGDHYLGALVLQPGGERSEYRIIDGQQRLVTLSILALAVIKRIEQLAVEGQEPDDNRERARLLRDSFVSKKDPASLQHRPRVVLNQRDNNFYATYLVNVREYPRPRTLQGSERRLYDAQLWFDERINRRFERPSGAELVAFLDRIVARRLRFIEIIVQNDETAFTVFETLNARGMALGTADLLKNFLFSKAAAGGQGDLEQANLLWQRILEHVPMEQLSTMLFHQLAGQVPEIREKRVFAEVKQIVNTRSGAVFEFLEQMVDTAILYSALDDPEADLWTDYPDCRGPLRVLKLLSMHQCRPLLLVAFRRFQDQPPKLARLFQAVVTTSVRSSVMHVNTGDVQRAYHLAALKTDRGELRSPAQIARALRPIYGSDEDFRQRFEMLSLNPRARSKQLVRYLFARLEAAAGGQAIHFEEGSVTIEHILPENPAHPWEAFSGAERERDLCRLGNLTPLEGALNRSIGASGYERKREVYAKSGFILTRTITAEEWSPSAIRERQRHLAELAVKAWSIESMDDPVEG